MKPTTDDVYKAFIGAGWNGAYADVYGFLNTSNPSAGEICVLSDLYFEIKRKFRYFKIEEFHEMLTDMYKNWLNWHGFTIRFQRGILNGVMTQKVRERKIIPSQGWKFISIKKVSKK